MINNFHFTSTLKMCFAYQPKSGVFILKSQFSSHSKYAWPINTHCGDFMLTFGSTSISKGCFLHKHKL